MKHVHASLRVLHVSPEPQGVYYGNPFTDCAVSLWGKQITSVMSVNHQIAK